MSKQTKPEVCRGYHPGDVYLRRGHRSSNRIGWLSRLRRQAWGLFHGTG